ncbi:MAG: four helix bundle protein [Candidatus Tritonobacter lacicola]|nr:four helix bundle protein [Candidatus Tritonobacter lacicola]
MKNPDYKDYVFDFEKLDVYKLSLDFVHKVISIIKKLPSELRFTIGGNLIRASMSIPNNIAEGSGKRSKKEKARFYGYSLNSVRECIPSISVLFGEKEISKAEMRDLRSDCVRIGSMLARLIQST